MKTGFLIDSAGIWWPGGTWQHPLLIVCTSYVQYAQNLDLCDIYQLCPFVSVSPLFVMPRVYAVAVVIY